MAKGAAGWGVETYAAAMREIFAVDPMRAPAIIAKALLGRAISGMGPDQFFLFDLHNRPAASWRDYLSFDPNFGRALNLINLGHRSIERERDKLVATLRLADAGVPIAPILLVLGRAPDRVSGSVEAPASIDAAAIRLAAADLPDTLFIKPCADFGGHGVTLAERVSGGWQVAGERLSPRALAEGLWDAGGRYGMLVQARLRNHAALADLGGDFGLCSVRIVVALTHDGPRVLTASIKLLREPGLADNFSEGHSGNLLANVDVATGCLDAAYGRAPGTRFLMSRYDRHPTTGAALVGRQLPLWRETVAAAEATSRAMVESPLLGIDIAITDGGPVVLERNLRWDLALPQLASGEGMRAMLRRALPELAVDEEVRRRAAQLLFGRPSAAPERAIPATAEPAAI